MSGWYIAFVVVLAVDLVATRVVLGRLVYWQQRLIDAQREQIRLLEDQT